jgi:putative hydrolase of the HAD superfamily
MTIFILDLDNTLFDTRSIPAELTDRLHFRLRQANAECHALSSEVLEQAISDTWYAPFSAVCERYSLPRSFLAIWNEWQETVSFDQPLVPYPDVVSSLRILRNQGHLLCLLTSGERRFQQAKIKALRITPFFDEIHIDAVDEFRPGKAAIISGLLLSRNWNRKDLLIVGDSATNEIDAGLRLGISTIQILRPGVVATDLADRHIHSLLELCHDTASH